VEPFRTPRSLPVLSTRRWTGIEPARELVAPSSVLKTAGPTRNPDTSGIEDSGAGRGARGGPDAWGVRASRPISASYGIEIDEP